MPYSSLFVTQQNVTAMLFNGNISQKLNNGPRELLRTFQMN
jgi:hypothetical protein